MAANARFPLEVPMRCERCGAYASRADSHCWKCGAELRNLRLPVKRPSAYPTVWRQAAPVLARGAALVAIGVAAEVAVTALARAALRLPLARGRSKARPLPARRNGKLREGALAVSETVIVRRLIFRR